MATIVDTSATTTTSAPEVKAATNGSTNGSINGSTNDALEVNPTDEIAQTLEGVAIDNKIEEGEDLTKGISSVYSASVIRGDVTYIFTSEIDRVQGHIVVVRRIYHNDYWGPRQTLRVGRIVAPRARGDMSASLFEYAPGQYGIRLYVMHDTDIIEYCLDTKPNEKDVWHRGQFTRVNVKRDSFLTTFGSDQLKSLGVTYEGMQALLRVFIVENDSPYQVSMYTHAGPPGKGHWYKKLIEN